MPRFSRRSLLAGASVLPVLPAFDWLGPAAAAETETETVPAFGQPYPFDFERLRARAKALASRIYEPPRIRVPEMLEDLGYLAHRDIAFRPEFEVWKEGPYPVRLFHLGRHFKAPVNIHLVEDGQAREVLYSPDLFAFGERARFASALPSDLGFAGFRLMNGGDEPDWLAFLGASYFRSSGELGQYGMSARGIATGTGLPEAEEFPQFTSFWLEAVPDRPAAIAIYALLDGPSIAGAYRMVWERGDVVTAEVETALYVRKDIARLGIAPLTSMFWFAGNSRHMATDWRPEVHDSDGLAIWTGDGERIWRPLYNPPTVQANSFVDRAPKGFGLVQRERDFERYQDDRRFYERRPSVWVEPLGEWGEGAVQLVEIPTADEIHDNIVAFWHPARPAVAGSEWTFSYRLHWVEDAPFPAELGRVVATRTGRAGPPGRRPPKGAYRFVVDFRGGELDRLSADDPVEAMVKVSRGEIERVRAARVALKDERDQPLWRASFDIEVDGTEPVDMRLFLQRGGGALTETWMFQYPPPTGD